ncbi:MAG: VWA domain-containing protein, partial [Gudongella sp.]|nr:VWA domain-containing protein [Gudongella sp.]
MKFFKKHRIGITLVELLIALGLISTIIGISTNLVLVGNKTQKLTVKEYAMQSDIRIATEKTNEAVRYSKAIFAVPETFVASVDTMDPGWNYLMATPDGKRIVNMVYDDELEKHVENVIVDESADISYYIKFENDSSAEHNNVLQYKIYAYNVNKFGQKVNEKLIFESSVDAVNAIQTVDKGSSTSPSVALAYRSDGQTSGKGKNEIAYITIIIDVSGSMKEAPDGKTASKSKPSRIDNVKKALIGDGKVTDNGIIQMFSKEDNVFISLVPFARTANYPNPNANTNPSAVHPIFEAYESGDSNSLITTIKNLKADGGTNTGDALRRAYYLHDTFRERMSVKEE